MRGIVSWGLTIAVAVASFWLASRGVDWRGVLKLLASVDFGLAGLAAACSSAAFVFRSVRWRGLLGIEDELGVWPVFLANMAGYMGNNYLPARAGEVIRCGLISSRSGIAMSRTFTSAIVERLGDAILLISWTPLVLMSMTSKPEWLLRAEVPLGFIGAGALSVAVIVPILGSKVEPWVRRIPASQDWKDRLTGVFHNILEGLRVLHSGRQLGRFLVLTGFVWIMDCSGVVFVGKALGFGMSLQAALLLLSGLGLSSAIPSTPGSLGIYQYVAVSVLAPFGFARQEALAFVLLFQALNYVVVSIWGLAGVREFHTEWGATFRLP